MAHNVSQKQSVYFQFVHGLKFCERLTLKDNRPMNIVEFQGNPVLSRHGYWLFILALFIVRTVNKSQNEKVGKTQKPE